MKLVTRDEVRMMVSIALTVAAPYKKRAVGLVAEEARRDVTEDLVHRLMGAPESESVILRPSLVGSPLSPSHGVWDVDEPHPHPELRNPVQPAPADRS